jgi:tRNA A-37 threonylcarbamoyl transferase component Bud32
MEPLTQTTPTPPPRGGEEPAGTDLSGRTIGDFQVIRCLGQGGMGQVYLAEQVSLKRKVALKVLRRDLAGNETSLARFKAEAEAVARATHANIVQVYYIGTVDSLPFMALEYVEGKNLREYLAKKGPPDLPLALSIMRQVAAALVRAGELGIIHRDIKPDNILLTRKGEVKVADFGLSRALTAAGDVNLTQSGVTMGTPLYMAPEQAEGKPLDCRADIYSLGVTCYHMFAGEPPFRGATAIEVALQHITGQAPQLAEARPDLPAALCALVHRMMARRPEDRFQTARDMLREIVRLREGVSGAVPLPTSMPSVDVEPVLTEGSSSALVPASGLEETLAAEAAPERTGTPRWLTVGLFGASVVMAAIGGVILARVRHASATITSRASSAEVTDVDAAPLDDEPALRRAAEIYVAAGPGKDVSVGMSLCLRLAILYLDQHRLEEAEKLFSRLDNIDKVQSYHIFGRVGRGIVLALQDQAKESNALFREVAYWLPHREGNVPKGGPRRPDPELVKVYQNSAFLYWLARAVRYNHINGVPDDQVPTGFHRLLDLKPKL